MSSNAEHARAHLVATLIPIDELLATMATADPPTTITLRTSTRHLLESVKRPGESYDELLQELIEEHYPPRVLKELKRRVADLRAGRTKGLSMDEAYRQWGV